jgi:RNA polymerase sigma-70 factor, ECF subfamily
MSVSAALPRMDPDQALVDALRRDAADGGSNAAEALVDAYGDRVYRLTFRITGSREDAEEATQDALWTVARKIDTFKGDSAFGSWLYRIAANAAYQKLRSRKSKALDGDGRHWEPMDDWSRRVDEHAMQNELRGVLEEAIAALPPDYRTAVILHDVEGMSNPDIAETLGISLAAVKSRVHRSRLYLRQRLARWMDAAR